MQYQILLVLFFLAAVLVTEMLLWCPWLWRVAQVFWVLVGLVAVVEFIRENIV